MKIVELFAGVGGFRIGFERASSDFFNTIWANQWEPGKKSQHAFDCYNKNFKNKSFCINKDIALVKNDIPNHDLLCGGFPCQDYSVAHSNAKGIEGKKGVLWWEIRDIIEKKKPRIIFLENVDRLLKSPAKQRGRDFGIILKCLDNLDYVVEWRVINAADYGHPQKRRRIFIICYKKNEKIFKEILKENIEFAITKNTILAKSFKTTGKVDKVNSFSILKINDLVRFSKKFNERFENAGIMFNGNVYTAKVNPQFKGKSILLNDVLDSNVDKKYFVNKKDLKKWKYLKGSKRELRHKPNGDPYYYCEGPIPFPDNLNSPARTMLTSESSINRSSHIIMDPHNKKYRILTPEECEKINEFPIGWTKTGMPEKFRYFVMGNALVVGLIESVAKVIKKEFK